MKKILSIVIVVLMIITALSVYVMNMMGDRIIAQMIESELSSFDTNSLPGNSEEIKKGTSSDDSGNANERGGEKNHGREMTEGLWQEGRDGQSKPAAETDGNKPSHSGSSKKEVKITVEEINEIKDKITFSDKMTAASLVMKKLTADDINLLKDMLGSGLSDDEKREAKKIAYSRFDEEEIKRVKEIYHKYMD
ncbi:hypothetical protein DFR58_1039 [Anaerobacterium chartisolvens]|uniref:Uncharacterized protein n=1 Tax=Anaerobacterium chartisolvens TaxID=1297424 RepID=A0A369BDF6_9FIRM|nr:hypothetical protein [Anaerobacterium chartisolvens]RCX19265.1 hypothetical protein DFR58_1039 [Anaerobacterium chartisolvens]